MRVTVVSAIGHAQSAVELTDLGCEVTQHAAMTLPGVIVSNCDLVLVEADGDGELGRFLVSRVRSTGSTVPVLLALRADQLLRLEPSWGHDDFVLMPYLAHELYARVRAIEWRRSEFAQPERLKLGGLLIEPAAHLVSANGRPIEMPHREYQVLLMLATMRGKVVARDSILGKLWGVRGAAERAGRSLDVHMRRLRTRLVGIVRIETVRGVGYRLEA